MTPTQRNDLRAKAMAATEGPWVYVPDNEYDDWELYNPETSVWVKQDDSGVPILKEDGNYIASASPDVILALLTQLEEYEEALQSCALSDQVQFIAFGKPRAKAALAKYSGHGG